MYKYLIGLAAGISELTERKTAVDQYFIGRSTVRVKLCI
jgi:hypothetical protein